jgi:ABC-type polysaccharide/polyol phosphate export permease
MKKIKKFYKKINETLEISLAFAKANFKLRNEKSYLGIFWYLLEPLLFLIILLALRGITTQNQIAYYPIYLFTGLVTYNFFSHVTTISTNIIQSKSKLIKNLTFPKEAIILSTPLQFLYSHLFELIILILFLIYYKLPIYTLFAYPLIFLSFLIFTTGISFIIGTIGVFIQDLKNVWGVFLRILWFATPIFYSIQGEGKIMIINKLNPLTHFLNLIRELILNQTFHLESYLIITFLSFITILTGLIIFNKYKIKFAEKI